MGQQIYTEPQPAPWPVGTRLKFIGGADGFMSGYVDDSGKTVWTHKYGVIYTVVKTCGPRGMERYFDDETGEFGYYPVHGWSALQSELDPEGRHRQAIDIDAAHDYEVL